jgi:hypothetical protein
LRYVLLFQFECDNSEPISSLIRWTHDKCLPFSIRWDQLKPYHFKLKGNYNASNNIGSSGPFVSSRFGSGIDARRKLNIMQHQHQQFASLHSNQASLLFPVTNPPTYYQPQTMPMTSTQSGATHPSSSFGVRLSAGSNPPGQNAVDLGSNTSQSASLGSSSAGQGSSNQVPG